MAENVVGLGKLNKRLSAIVAPKAKRLYLRGIADTGVHEARARVKHRTGQTSKRIKVGRVTPETAELKASGAAAFLEGGAVKHDIVPKHGKALAFTSQRAVSARFGSRAKLKTKRSGALTKGSQKRYGSAAFTVVRKVRHPGQKATPFLRPAAVAAIQRNEMKGQLVREWNLAG